MTFRYDQEIEQMAAVCVPIEADADRAEATSAREELLKFLMKTLPYGWTYGEPRKEPGTDDVVIVDVTYYSNLGEDTGTPVKESRQARLRQIDGKWYLLPESLRR
jgi:hypothetical protein